MKSFNIQLLSLTLGNEASPFLTCQNLKHRSSPKFMLLDLTDTIIKQSKQAIPFILSFKTKAILKWQYHPIFTFYVSSGSKSGVFGKTNKDIVASMSHQG